MSSENNISAITSLEKLFTNKLLASFFLLLVAVITTYLIPILGGIDIFNSPSFSHFSTLFIVVTLLPLIALSWLFHLVTHIFKLSQKNIARAYFYIGISALFSLLLSWPIKLIGIPSVISYLLGAGFSLWLITYLYQIRFLKALYVYIASVAIMLVIPGIIWLTRIHNEGNLKIFGPSELSQKDMAKIDALVSELPEDFPLPDKSLLTSDKDSKYSFKFFPAEGPDVWRQKYESYFQEKQIEVDSNTLKYSAMSVISAWVNSKHILLTFVVPADGSPGYVSIRP